MEKREEEFAELENRAKWILENPEALQESRNRKSRRKVISLWHHPAFGLYRLWVLYDNIEPEELEGFCLLTVTWDRPFDVQRLRIDPMKGLKEGFHTGPTISSSETTLPKNKVNELLNKLRKLSIPAFVKNDSLGLDGEIYGIEVASVVASAKVSWWCEGPDEWRDLAQVATELINVFTEHDKNV